VPADICHQVLDLYSKTSHAQKEPTEPVSLPPRAVAALASSDDSQSRLTPRTPQTPKSVSEPPSSSGFLQVRENWKKVREFEWSGKGQGKIFFGENEKLVQYNTIIQYNNSICRALFTKRPGALTETSDDMLCEIVQSLNGA